ncbi:MAG: IS110 family transposase [Sedimentisphaerales bacterium]|nr:IS110 family transposase [Sedimentisphaerales bacterium]
MRYYTKQHQYYCGVDLHARTLYLCIVNQRDEILDHREIPAKAEVFLEKLAPYREDVVGCVECMFTWYWVADRCAIEKIPFVLGHALYMKAMSGAKIKNDRLDSKKIAKLLRAGMIPMAYVYPKAMRSTRDLLRRRMVFVRHRADLLTHIQQTNTQYNFPKIGKTLKYTSNREGVAERFEDESVRKTVDVDLELIAFYDRIIGKLERHLLWAAKAHDATALHLLRPIPGIGKILSLVILYEVQDISRFPRPQQFVSYARLIRSVRESTGKRTGTANGKMGNAYVKWAFSEAVVLFLRETREAQPYIRRLECKYGKDKAKGILAHRLGRTVYYMLKHQQVFDIKKFVNQCSTE